MDGLPRRAVLEQMLATSAPVRTHLDEQSELLLTQLRESFPLTTRLDGLKPGEVGGPIVLTEEQVAALFRSALSNEANVDALLLTDGDSELLIHAAKCRIILRDGLMLVSLVVECDQTDAVEVTVPLAIGSAKEPAGMIIATESLPRGPSVVVSIWGEAMQALAWEAVLLVAAGISRHAGTDLEAGPLVPGAIVATKGALTIVPQARHDIDLRRTPPRRL